MKSAKALGFSLQEIREILPLQDENADACTEVRDLLQAKLSIVQEKKAQLEILEAHLSAAVGKCNQALKQQPKSPGSLPGSPANGRSIPNSGEMKLNRVRQVAARDRRGSRV